MADLTTQGDLWDETVTATTHGTVLTTSNMNVAYIRPNTTTLDTSILLPNGPAYSLKHTTDPRYADFRHITTTGRPHSWGRQFIYLTASPGAPTYIWQAKGATNTAWVATVRLNTTRNLYLRDGLTGPTGSGNNYMATPLALNTWYGLEWEINQTAGTQFLRVYEDDGTFIDEIDYTVSGGVAPDSWYGGAVDDGDATAGTITTLWTVAHAWSDTGPVGLFESGANEPLEGASGTGTAGTTTTGSITANSGTLSGASGFSTAPTPATATGDMPGGLKGGNLYNSAVTAGPGDEEVSAANSDFKYVRDNAAHWVETPALPLGDERTVRFRTFAAATQGSGVRYSEANLAGSPLVGQTEVWIREAIYFNSLPPANSFLLMAKAGATHGASVRLTPTGILQLCDGQTGPTSGGSVSTFALQTGTWYFLEWNVDLVNNTQELIVRDALGNHLHESTPITYVVTAVASTVDTFGFGINDGSSTTTWDLYTQGHAVSNDTWVGTFEGGTIPNENVTVFSALGAGTAGRPDATTTANSGTLVGTTDSGTVSPVSNFSTSTSLAGTTGSGEIGISVIEWGETRYGEMPYGTEVRGALAFVSTAPNEIGQLAGTSGDGHTQAVTVSAVTSTLAGATGSGAADIAKVNFEFVGTTGSGAATGLLEGTAVNGLPPNEVRNLVAPASLTGGVAATTTAARSTSSGTLSPGTSGSGQIIEGVGQSSSRGTLVAPPAGGGSAVQETPASASAPSVGTGSLEAVEGEGVAGSFSTEAVYLSNDYGEFDEGIVTGSGIVSALPAPTVHSTVFVHEARGLGYARNIDSVDAVQPVSGTNGSGVTIQITDIFSSSTGTLRGASGEGAAGVPASASPNALAEPMGTSGLGLADITITGRPSITAVIPTGTTGEGDAGAITDWVTHEKTTTFGASGIGIAGVLSTASQAQGVLGSASGRGSVERIPRPRIKIYGSANTQLSVFSALTEEAPVILDGNLSGTTELHMESIVEAPYLQSKNRTKVSKKGQPLRDDIQFKRADQVDLKYLWQNIVWTEERPLDGNNIPMFHESELPDGGVEGVDYSVDRLVAPWEQKFWRAEIRNGYESTYRYFNGWVPWYGTAPKNWTWWTAASLKGTFICNAHYSKEYGGTIVDMQLPSNVSSSIQPSSVYNWDLESASVQEWDDPDDPVVPIRFNGIKTWVGGKCQVTTDWTINTPIGAGLA